MKKCSKVSGQKGTTCQVYYLWLVSPVLTPISHNCFCIAKLAYCPLILSWVFQRERHSLVMSHSSHTVQGVYSQDLYIFPPSHCWQWHVLLEKVIGTFGYSTMQHDGVSKVLEHCSTVVHYYQWTMSFNTMVPECFIFLVTTSTQPMALQGDFTRFHYKAAPGIQLPFTLVQFNI